MKSAIVLLALLTSLSGCAKSINWQDPQEISRHIAVGHDAFKNLDTFDGPNCAGAPNEDIVLLRAWRIADKPTAFQLYVSDEYTYEIMRSGVGWRFYSLAHDSDGNQLPTVQISRNVNWCGRYVCAYREDIAVTLTREYLEAKRDRGISIKVSGKGGEQIVAVPPAYIQAFLSSVH